MIIIYSFVYTREIVDFYHTIKMKTISTYLGSIREMTAQYMEHPQMEQSAVQTWRQVLHHH